MSNIIPFDSEKLPAYLKGISAVDLNSDLTAHAASGGFPVMSIKGKTWTVVREGERNPLTKVMDGEEVPAPSVDVVLIKVNKGVSKVFYLKGYQEGVEAQKPDCFSTEGTHPDASVEAPQSKSCATCKHNQWGSKVGDSGSSKGKACQDSVRIAISPAGQINDPMLLRVPPASIKTLGEYGKMLAKRGVRYNMPVTRISFEMESPTPKLVFKAMGLLDDAGYKEAQAVANSETVQSILGSGFVDTTEATNEEAVPAIEAKPVVKAKAAPETVEKVVAKTVAKAVADAEVEIDLNLDDLNFDD